MFHAFAFGAWMICDAWDGCQMPIMNGLLATQLIRQEEMERGWSRIPILGLTAHTIDGYQDKCFSHGMDSYLGKPFDIRQLLSTIGHILPPKG
jgi:osomolarity two-component system sensor histidine kinase NIK1